MGSAQPLSPRCSLPSGDGYCRSEAVVAVLLTKKSLARRVYATILSTGTNTDGFKEQGGRLEWAGGRGGGAVAGGRRALC